MAFADIRDDKEYWKDESEYQSSLGGKFCRLRLLTQVDTPDLGLDVLCARGLTAAPQGPVRLRGEILSYIETKFSNADRDDFFPEALDSTAVEFEGMKKQITVNKYERSSIARAKCIECHGYICATCKFDFEKEYGEIGREFIHVHHVRPISSIGKSYRIDYEKDLIPICPNCHAMLHRKLNGKELSIDELRELVAARRKQGIPSRT